MKTHRILIADDDLAHMQMLEIICSNAGYRVICATSTQQAIDLAEQLSPDLLLLDVHIGMSEGYSVHERVLEMDRTVHTPAIYLTGDKSSWVECRINMLGAHSVFRKPFAMDRLLTAIKNALNARDAELAGAVLDRRHTMARTRPTIEGRSIPCDLPVPQGKKRHLSPVSGGMPC